MTKISILSGFLGAGKTTLLRTLIEGRPAGMKLAIIENEFGQVGLDGRLLEESGFPVMELNAGCICCSLTGDYAATLEKLYRVYKPDHILIEPSGVGLLSDIKKGTEAFRAKNALRQEGSEMEQDELSLASLVTVVDAQNHSLYAENFAHFYRDQIAGARLLLLSRTEALDEAALATVDASLAVMNPRAERLCFVPGAEPATFWWDFVMERGAELAKASPEALKGRVRRLMLSPRRQRLDANQAFESRAYGIEKAVTLEGFERLMQGLESGELGQILRAKGFFELEEGHEGHEGGLQHFDYVPQVWAHRAYREPETPLLIVIGAPVDWSRLEAFGANCGFYLRRALDA